MDIGHPPIELVHNILGVSLQGNEQFTNLKEQFTPWWPWKWTSDWFSADRNLEQNSFSEFNQNWIAKHQDNKIFMAFYHHTIPPKNLSQKMLIRNMTLNLLGCVRLNSLGDPIGVGMGDSNASASAVASPSAVSPSPVAVVMRRRRAKCSANQKRRAGSGHARHNQTLEHREGKVSENYGRRIILWWFSGERLRW